jgi:hypothetical protein
MKQKASNLFLINVKPNKMPMEQKAGFNKPIINKQSRVFTDPAA